MRDRLSQILNQWTERGYLHVASALLFEFLIAGFVVFAALFTFETLLPTSVMPRLSLAKLLFALLMLLALLGAINRRAGIVFSDTFPLAHPLVIMAGIWGVLVMLVSSYRFPVWSIFVLLPLFLVSVSLWWHLSSKSESENEKIT